MMALQQKEVSVEMGKSGPFQDLFWRSDSTWYWWAEDEERRGN